MMRRIRDAMTLPSARLDAHREEVRAIIARHGATNPRVFGSVARGEDAPGSDVDLLVRPAATMGLAFFALAEEVEACLGVPVDVVSDRDLGVRHAAMLAEAVPL
jgi:predicted nucleotidyltransferase